MKYRNWLLVSMLCAAAIDSMAQQPSFESIMHAAQKGDAAAESLLGDIYRTGRQGVGRDYAEAVKWYKLAAKEGNAAAKMNLGTMYHLGLGVPKDDAQALVWYQTQVRIGSPMAIYMTAQIYQRGGEGVKRDLPEAVRLYQKCINEGYKPASEALGELYYRGEGVPQDFAKAFTLLRPSALTGDANAELMVGLMYRSGVGGKKDPQEAAILIARSAEWGLVPAQLEYGAMLRDGSNGTKDLVEAYKWFLVASDRADAENKKKASAALDGMRNRVSTARIAEARENANLWLKRHPAPYLGQVR